MKVQDLDYLGILARIIDHLRLEEHINQCLGNHLQQIVSPDQGVKAMILNGLYRDELFWTNLDCSRDSGQSVTIMRIQATVP